MSFQDFQHTFDDDANVENDDKKSKKKSSGTDSNDDERDYGPCKIKSPNTWGFVRIMLFFAVRSPDLYTAP